MAYTVDDFKHDTWLMMIDDVNFFTPAQRAVLRERLEAEEQGYRRSIEDRLRGLSPDDILRGMDPEVVKAWLKRNGY
ncbi:MAG: hypothetical protein WBJ41_00905 [Chromatiaceae bacterium]